MRPTEVETVPGGDGVHPIDVFAVVVDLGPSGDGQAGNGEDCGIRELAHPEAEGCLVVMPVETAEGGNLN